MKKRALTVFSGIAALCLLAVPISALPVSADDSASATPASSEEDAMSKEYTTEFSSFENYSDAFKILDLVNAERAKENLAPLTMDQSLLDTAMLRGHEIELCFDHTRPDGSMCYTANNLISGENIAAAMSADQAMSLWMNSSDHKANILGKGYTSIGIGAIKSSSGMNYYVQCFGRSLATEADVSDYSSGYVNRTVAVRGDFINQYGTLSASSSEIATGTTVKISFDIYNTFITEHGFTFDNVQYVSSDPSIVSVSGSTITANKPGTVTITAQLNGNTDATLSSKLTITVMNPWRHDNNGWWYKNNDGSYPANTWKQINGKWYFFNANGYMTTGWQYIHGSWYYMSSGGDMLTGWIYVGNTWYYLQSSGNMASGWQHINNNWYFFNSSGAMQTGWLNSNGTWYYLNGSGAMKTGWGFINGSWYYFSSQGNMLTGWQLINNTWYFLDSSGTMHTGWLYNNGSWYFLNGSGAMLTGLQTINRKTHLFAQSGAMLTGWQQINEKWCYFDSNGAMVKNRWIGDYYLGSDGYMAVNTTTPDGYQVGNDGRWVRSSSLIEGTSYIVNTKTLKFHCPWCHEVSKISSSNRADVGNSKNALISFGYEPCKICNP
ncbi:MAG: CAP domain-containing protein [Erysipelotrichaceae bacterium]|nr:CAP domain-containing protein [Erysipelotrichaceae bacterium]